jgi:subtilisin family serine protease
MKYLIMFLLSFSCLAGSVEKRKKIAVLDTGIGLSQILQDYMCKDSRKTLLPLDAGLDKHGHGKNVIGLIAKEINSKTHCIVSYKIFNYNLKKQYMNDGIRQAIKDGVKYINISGGGPNSEPDSNKEERRLIRKALKKGIVVILASGNQGLNLDKNCNYYPACYKKDIKNDNLIVVGAKDVKSGNKGKIIDFYEKGKLVGTPVMSGTSQATATVTGKIASGKLKKHGIIIHRRLDGTVQELNERNKAIK